MQISNPGVPDNSITAAKLVDGAALANLIKLASWAQVFTANGSYTVPETGYALVICIGGGAGGGGGGATPKNASARGVGGIGGSAGQITCSLVHLTKGDVYAVTVGAGGAGGTSENPGGVGTVSLFGGLVTALGAYATHTVSGYSTAVSNGSPGSSGGGYGGGLGGGMKQTAGNGLNANAAFGYGAGGGGGGGAYGSTASEYNGGTGGNGADGLVVVIG